MNSVVNSYTNETYGMDFVNDFFFSYDSVDLLTILVIQEIFFDNGLTKICVPDSNFTNKAIKEAVNGSKSVILFISSAYTKSFNKIDELVYASFIQKPVFVIMLEKLDCTELGQLGQHLSKSFNYPELFCFETSNLNELAIWISKQLKPFLKNESCPTQTLNMHEKDKQHFNLSKCFNTIESKLNLKLNKILNIASIYFDEFRHRIVLYERNGAVFVEFNVDYLLEISFKSKVNSREFKLTPHLINEPGCMCFSQDFVFISDSTAQTVLQLNTHFNFIKTIMISHQPGFIKYMLLDNQKELFSINTFRQRIEVFDVEKNMRVRKQIELYKRCHQEMFKIKENVLFALCHDSSTRQSYIFAIDKFTLNTLNKIASFNSLIHPFMLIDDCMNIVTIEVENFEAHNRNDKHLYLLKKNISSGHVAKIYLMKFATTSHFNDIILLKDSNHIICSFSNGNFRKIKFY